MAVILFCISLPWVCLTTEWAWWNQRGSHVNHEKPFTYVKQKAPVDRKGKSEEKDGLSLLSDINSTRVGLKHSLDMMDELFDSLRDICALPPEQENNEASLPPTGKEAVWHY